MRSPLVRLSVTFALAAVSAVLFPIAAGAAGSATEAFWADLSPAAIPVAGERLISPLAYRALRLDLDGLGAFLASVPRERTPGEEGAVLALPLPDGTFGRFLVVEAPIMAPGLAARFPEIRTYAARGLDDRTATARLDLTPHGFHALVLAVGGSIYIDPYQRGDLAHYQSYYRRDLVADRTLGGCTVIDEDGMAEEISRLIDGGSPRSGTELRTYRAAVAATGEYTTFHGGTVPLGLAAVVTSMNRVTGVYERDVSIRMELVASNDLIIYTNGATDPYTNNDGGAMLGQNQTNLDAVIGTLNYDIGHVFSTGGGGVAYLGVVCRAGLKARGVTGSGQPIGDGFDIDYVAHEIGHQFGSNHSFNGTAGSCGGGNRNASTAYEPGSGSTIMAYAGICGFQNLQAHSDDYFVWKSIDEIVAYSTLSYGNGCAVVTATGAVEPVVEAGTGGFTIPLRTPFKLVASATATGEPTYCWEESDLGPAGHPDTPSGNAPIFRSFDPVASPERTFPKVTDLVNNVHTIGELLPTYARGLSFKVTVRDVQAGGVGVAKDAIAFSVAAVGPFSVTEPNTSSVIWTAETAELVTWDVASTDLAPINCATTNILLSTDGGYTWPTVLAAGTPNDGSESVLVPLLETAQARIKVEAADNIFFDISNQSFTIALIDPTAAPLPASSSRLALRPNQPNPFHGGTTIRFQMPERGSASVRVFDPSGRLVRTLVDGFVAAGEQTAVWDGTDARGTAVGSGVYVFELRALGRTLSGRMTVVR